MLRRAPAPSNTSHIRYSEETGSIPRDVLMEFLQTAVKMLLDEGNQREMVLEAAAKGQGLDRIAVEFQRDILEYNFHIEKGFGCKYLSLLGERFPDDEDLLATASAFMFTCQASYVDCLRLRSRMYSKGEVPAPDPTGVMGRTAILEFFEGCTALSKPPSVLFCCCVCALVLGAVWGERGVLLCVWGHTGVLSTHSRCLILHLP